MVIMRDAIVDSYAKVNSLELSSQRQMKNGQ